MRVSINIYIYIHLYKCNFRERFKSKKSLALAVLSRKARLVGSLWPLKQHIRCLGARLVNQLGVEPNLISIAARAKAQSCSGNR